jgi:branched-chain amino acid transport system substrate-binding protein
MRRMALLALLALTAGACSVSTPRHESLSLRSRTQTASATDNAATSGTPQTDGTTTAASAATNAAAQTARSAGIAAASASKTAGTAAGRTVNTASAPGVTADTITMSIVAGFSGTLSPIVNKAYEALQTWQEDTNAAGGIYGRKVIFKKVDHKETPDGGVAACKEVQSNGSFIAAVPEGTDANLTAVDCLDAAGIPTIYFAAAADPKWKIAFADSLTSAQGGTILASYVKNTLRAASKKLGVMYVNQSAYKAAADAFSAEAKKAGMDVADTEPVEPNQASFTSQLLRMKQKNVEVVLISATAESLGILRDAKSMGYTPQFTGWGYLFDFLTAAGRSVYDGVTGLRPYATVDSPQYAVYAQRMAARGRDRSDRGTDLEGFPTYGRALLYGELLRRAGQNPTRASFVTGAETLKNFTTDIIPPVTYGVGPALHSGITAGFIAACCNSDNTWKGTGPARTSF